jgi:hypothetical protein
MPKDFCRAKYEPVSLESREGCRTGHDSPSTDCRSGGLDELEAIEKRVRADLLAEGFQTVQTWSEPANTCYEDQAYSHDVIVHIVRGSLVIVHGDQVTGMTVGRSKVLPGEVAFALRIGPHGCRYIFAY